MENLDILAVAAGVGICILLYCIAGRAERIKSTKWKLFWLLPAVVLAFTGHFERSLIPLYLGIVILIAGFFREKTSFRRGLSIAGALSMLAAVPASLLNPRYREKDYIGEFQKGYDTMRAHYVLTEHKGIDWDALYTKYMPMIEEADREQDAVKNYLAWSGFCGAFHDGHVGYYCEKETMEAAARSVLGNDYGLAVMRMTDGRFAAVNTDASLKQYGIVNGTVITGWDGQAPDAVSRQSPAWGLMFYYYNPETDYETEFGCFPDIDNEIFYSGLLAGGVGGETVSVGILDETGTERTVTLPKIGEYYDRMFGSVEKIDNGVNIDNLEWQRAGKTSVLLRIRGMAYDTASYMSGEEKSYREMKEKLIDALAEYKADGVKDVIIDLRNNGGGSPIMVKTIASLFAPEGTYDCSLDGLWDDDKKCWVTDENGDYVPGKAIRCQGENLLDGGKVIILTNQACVSAGDFMVKIMRDLPNVTVMGFTEPNGSCQAVGGVNFRGSKLSFSNCVNLDPAGGILIDSGTDRQSTDDIDVRIPFDQAAIRAVFDEGRDYVLECAVKAVSQQEH